MNHMTTTDLIAELEKYPSDTPVHICVDDVPYLPVVAVVDDNGLGPNGDWPLITTDSNYL